MKVIARYLHGAFLSASNDVHEKLKIFLCWTWSLVNQHPVICRTHPYRRKNEDSEKRKEKADGKEIAVSRDILES